MPKKMPLRMQSYLKKKQNQLPQQKIVVHPKEHIPSVLFLNHKKQACGVYQYGKRVYEILQKSQHLVYEYKEIENIVEYSALTRNIIYKAIVYNYHVATMPWLNENTIDCSQQNIGILHECNIHLFTKTISIDPNCVESTHVYHIPRPLIENIPCEMNESSADELKKFIHFQDGYTPIFGSFGFGFENKGFPRIVRMINEQYDCAIIKFIIPHAVFDPNCYRNIETSNKCHQENVKKNIILMIYTEFVSEHDLLVFLRSNTMNIFLYDQSNVDLHGISSTIDYALSVRRPLGISDSFMFRHIYSDDICLYKNPIQSCMENSLAYCEKFLSLYSHQNMIDKFNTIIHSP